MSWKLWQYQIILVNFSWSWIETQKLVSAEEGGKEDTVFSDLSAAGGWTPPQDLGLCSLS